MAKTYKVNVNDEYIEVTGKYWEGLHDDEIDAAYKQIVDKVAQKKLGRNLSVEELDTLGGQVGGSQSVKNLVRSKKDQQSSLWDLAARISSSFDVAFKDKLTEKTTTEKDYKGDVTETFQDVLGRDPTEEEMGYYEKELKEGSFEPYELKETILPTTEEAKQAKHKKALGELSTAMQKPTEQAFQQMQPQVMASFAKAGRLNTPAVDVALMREWNNLQSAKDLYIAQQQYGFDVGQMGQTYQSMLDLKTRQYQVQDMRTARQYQQEDITQQRRFNWEDYMQQQRDWQDYVDLWGKYNKQQQWIAGGTGLLSGAMGGLGAYYGSKKGSPMTQNA